MPQGTTNTVAATVSAPAGATHSVLDYLTAVGALSLPITAALVLLGLVLVAFRLIEVDFGVGKVIMKLRRPGKLPTLGASASATEGVAENIASPAPTAPEITAQAGRAEAEEKDDADATSPANHSWEYIVARTVEGLDAHWTGWKASVVPEHNEFWETDYRRRRADFGADHGREAMRQLALKHPTWAYPHAVLANWCREGHDLEASEAHLAAGLTRQASPQFGHVLSAGVTLRHETGGLRAALDFCLEWSKAQIPERFKAGLFHSLADLLEEIGDGEGYRVAYEWALLAHPGEKPRSFALAYDYAEAPSHWAPAMSTYQSIVGQGDNGAVSRNNLAILLGHFDKPAQIDSYEQAIAGGDHFAVANLAKLLITDGYVAAGERLLATVTEPSASAELHAGAASAALAARRALEKKQSEISALIKAQLAPYRTAVARSLRHLQSGGTAASGFYVSADGLTQLFLGPTEAQCRMRLGDTNYTGTCKWQASCYAGKLSWDGGGFFGLSFDVTVIDEGGGVVRLFLWPNAIGPDQSIAVHELRPSATQPPALPAPQTPSPSALGGLLGLGLAASN
jgi:hypothetical protein